VDPGRERADVERASQMIVADGSHKVFGGRGERDAPGVGLDDEIEAIFVGGDRQGEVEIVVDFPQAPQFAPQIPRFWERKEFAKDGNEEDFEDLALGEDPVLRKFDQALSLPAMERRAGKGEEQQGPGFEHPP
jgi:hypothetical protein